jgi:nucleoside-diphosphate-sugar epimerase
MGSIGLDRVLITGAAGVIGSRLAGALRADGIAVRGLVRPEHDARALEAAGVETVAADAGDVEAVSAAAAGCQVIVHLAAARGRHKLSAAAYRARNRQLSEAVAQAALRTGARRVVVTSTATVTGAAGPGRQTEATPCRPNSAYRASKLGAEQLFERFARDQGLGVVIARVCQRVLGPGAREWGPLFRAVRDRRIRLLPSGGTIHAGDIDDIVAGLRRCASTPGIDGERFLIAAAEPMPTVELLRAVAGALGVGFAPRLVGPLPCRAYVGIGNLAWRTLGVALPYHYTCELYTARVALDIGRARQRLGFAPAYSMRDGIERTATWLSEQGLV